VQPTCSCAVDPLANITQDITAGVESGLGSLVPGIIQNITGELDPDLKSNISNTGVVFTGVLKNTTETLNGTSTGTSTDSFIQDLVSNLIYETGSSLFSSLTRSTSELKVLFSSLISNFTAKVDNGLSKAEGTVAEGITNALGIQDFYSLHLRDVCSGTFPSSSDLRTRFNITVCFPYSVAASGKSSRFCADILSIKNYHILCHVVPCQRLILAPTHSYLLDNLSDESLGLVDLISKIPSSTTVLTTNITLPVITQVQELSIYLTHLTHTLDQIIFTFYLITLISSGFLILGSIAQFFLPTSSILIYANLVTSTLNLTSSLSASAATTAFLTTANNIINIFGSALNLHSDLGTSFLILTWTSFATALLTNWYIIAVWFIEFRTISIKVQRRSPQDLGNWRKGKVGIFRESKGGFVEEIVREISPERPEPDVGRRTSETMSRLSTRLRRRESVTANF
jgi:hypothetical protein